METTKKLNETPLIQQMTDKHTYIIVDDQGNVSRVKDVAKEYVTETELNDFIKPYDDRITTNETNISDLETNIGSTKTDVLDLESYMDIVTPKNTASGEIAYTTDALPLPTFGTKSDGQVEQVTTQGKQLYNYKDTITMVTHTVDEDDWITIAADNTNGTAEIYKNLFTNKSDLLKENTNYKCVLEIKNISQSDKTKGSYITMLGVETVTQFQKAKTIKLNELSIGTFVYDALTKESFEETSMMARNFIAISIGDSVSITFRLSVIEDTTVTPETFVYEPYTGAQASPNPDYQQPIEVLEGYNLIDIQNNNYLNMYSISNTHQNYGNGIAIEYNYKNLGSQPRIVFIKYPLKANKYYCLSAKITKLGTVDGKVSMYLPQTQQYPSIGKPFKPNSDTEWLGFYVEQHNFVEGVKYGITDVVLQEVDSLTATPKPYIPYGCICYKVNGNNIFDRNRMGYTVKPIFENDKIYWEGIDGYSYVDYKVYCKPNTKYIISFSDKYCTIILSKKANANDVINWDVENNYVFTTSDNMIEFYIRFTGNSSVTFYVDKFQIEPGDKSTPYEPYKEQIVYLDLKGNWVGAINDTIKDYLVTDKKKYWLVKNVGKVVLDGSEDWVVAPNNDNTTRFSYKGIDYKRANSYDDIPYFKNSHFQILGFGPIYTGGVQGICWWFRDESQSVVISFGDNKTLDEFKQWLSENNIELYYALATPEIIKLGELPEPIKTFEGVNNIQLLANLDTEIEVVYAQDVKKYIDSKLAEISAQII